VADRNRTDVDRGESLYRQFIQGERGVKSRDLYIDRADRDEYKKKVEQKTETSTFQRMVQIAGVGIGGLVLGKSIPKDIWVQALHKMGMYGRKNFGRMVHARNQLIEEEVLSRGFVLRGRERAPTVELADFIEKRAAPFLLDLEQSRVHTDARTMANIHVRRELQERFGQEATEGLTGLTIQDVIALSKTKHFSETRVISDRSIKTLIDFKKSLGHDSAWFDKLVVDRNLFKSKAGSLPKAIKASDILDTRWASRRAFGDLLNNGLGWQVPFVGFKPIDLIAPFFKMAGQSPQYARLGQGQRIAFDTVTPQKGISYLIDGGLFHFDHTGMTHMAVGKRFRAHVADSIGKANVSRFGAQPSQRFKPRPGSFIDSLQDLVGFGPAYRDESFVGSHLTFAAKINRRLKRGEVEWVSNPTVKLGNLPQKHIDDVLRKRPDLNLEDEIPNPIKTLDDLGITDRGGAFLGRARFGHFEDKVTKKKISLGAKRPGPKAFGGYIDQDGLKQSSGYTAYEDTLLTKANLLATFAGTRLNQLIGATMGIGFRPAMGRFAGFWNAMRIAAIGATFNPMGGYAVDAYKYVNYLFKQTTSGFGYIGDGIGPTDIAIKGYEAATLAAAGIKDITGITAGSSYIEDLFPGLFESSLSGMTRTGLMLYKGIRSGPMGLGIGAMAAIGTGSVSDIFGTNILGAKTTTSSPELYSLYSGDSQERIRKSRWWMLGRQPFYGEGTDRFEAHWVKLAKSDWEYSNSLYGSRREYFKHASSLPTPHNLFGLTKDSDYFAEKHAQTRPYENNSMSDGAAMAMLLSSEARGQIASAGFGVPVAASYDVGSKGDIGYQIKNKLQNSAEFLGVYKFLAEFVLGKSEYGPVYASPEEITSKNRLYWDKDIGGMLGFTELLRRFITKPNDIGASQIVNNAPNAMPNFLPGARSMFDQDRDYYKEFTLGDPYTKIKGGEYRLPGAGYEAVNKLHSGRKGVYDPVDALLILSDVAPYSQAYSYYRKIVSNMNLSSEWQQKVDTANEQRNIKAQGIAYDFRTPRFTMNQETIDANQEIVDDIRYNALERFLGTQYDRFTTQALPEIGRMIPMGGIITHKLFPHHTPEQDYLERVVYNARSSDWNKPYETFIDPKITTLYNENPFTAAAGGMGLSVFATTPGIRHAIGIAGGVGFGAASMYRAASLGRMEGGYVPEFRRNEIQVLDYMDKLEYMRMEYAANRASALGNNKAAADYRYRQSTETMLGLDYSNPVALVGGKRALPKNEKMYFDHFLNASPESRERILDMVPQYMSDIYRNVWEPGLVSIDPNAAMETFLNNNRVPDENWAGWNPGVQKWQIMSRTMDTSDNSVAIDLHRQTISTEMIQQTKMQLPNIGVDLGESMGVENYRWHEATSQKLELIQQSIRAGLYNVRVNSLGIGSPQPISRFNLQYNKQAEIRRAIEEAVR
jgi:hypothetical protein